MLKCTVTVHYPNGIFNKTGTVCHYHEMIGTVYLCSLTSWYSLVYLCSLTSWYSLPLFGDFLVQFTFVRWLLGTVFLCSLTSWYSFPLFFDFLVLPVSANERNSPKYLPPSPDCLLWTSFMVILSVSYVDIFVISGKLPVKTYCISKISTHNVSLFFEFGI